MNTSSNGAARDTVEELDALIVVAALPVVTN